MSEVEHITSDAVVIRIASACLEPITLESPVNERKRA